MQKFISLIYGKSYSWEMGDKYDVRNGRCVTLSAPDTIRMET